MLVYKYKWILKRLSQMGQKIAFTSSEEKIATEAMDKLIKLYDNCALEEADVIVALGGDGFMLQTLHQTQDLSHSPSLVESSCSSPLCLPCVK